MTIEQYGDGNWLIDRYKVVNDQDLLIIADKLDEIEIATINDLVDDLGIRRC